MWAHWTSPALVRQWWSPQHFDVAECEIDPVPGGRLEITMREPDGRRYASRGQFLIVTPPRRLRFELSHLTVSGAPLFTAIHDLRLTDHGQHTQLNLAIRVTAATPEAAAAVAGIRLGWEQLSASSPAPSANRAARLGQSTASASNATWSRLDEVGTKMSSSQPTSAKAAA